MSSANNYAKPVPNQDTKPLDDTDSKRKTVIENDGSHNGETCNMTLIKIENEMDYGSLPNSRLTSIEVKVENNLESKLELPKISDIKYEITEIKMEDNNMDPVTGIKVEKGFEAEGTSCFLKDRRYATIPEINNISTGEIKIEDGNFIASNQASEDESNDMATESGEESTSAKIKYNATDDGDMSLGDENSSSAESKYNDEDDMPTTSRKIKKEKTKSPAKKVKVLKIKEEINNETDSDQEDMDSFSDDKEEFLSNSASGEEFLSDGDENSSDNHNLTIDNKPIICQLIDEYHKRPQLWFKELSTEMGDLREVQLFRSINKALYQKFNMKFNVNRIKTIINDMCSHYEAEIERQLKENEETTPESSKLWYYDKLFFLKDDIENNVKAKLEKTLKLLDDNMLADLIDIYKKYDDLWDTNKLTFSNKKKRHETMQSMCLEVKNKMKISLNTFKLEYQLLNIHKELRESKKRRIAKEEEHKPSFPCITKCDFLENHQEPFKCQKCNKVLVTYISFRQHKAKHDGINPFKCNICGTTCTTLSNYYYHSYRHSGIDYSCRICGRKYLHPSDLKKHIIGFHMPPPDSKTFNCNICGKSFDRQKKLNAHLKEICKQEPILCKICGKICNSRKVFKQHSYQHDGKNYDCDICKKRFNTPRSLKSHITVVHTFKCKICAEICANKRSLNQHMASHDGKQFTCDVCGKGFDNQQKTYKHMRSHGKKYECRFCGKSLAVNSDLKKHLEVCKSFNNLIK